MLYQHHKHIRSINYVSSWCIAKLLRMEDYPDLKSQSDEALDFSFGYMRLNALQREGFLRHLTGKQCRILRNCVFNVIVNTSFNISQTDRKYLKKYMPVLKKIASKRICVGDKREVLVKKNLLIRRVLKIVISYIESEKIRLDKQDAAEGTGED